MRPKHVPMRRCLSCRLSKPQKELYRLVRQDEAWHFDASGKAPGRGAWLCRDKPECLELKALKRALKGQAERIKEEIETHAQRAQQPKPQRLRVNARKSENGGLNV